MTDIKARSVKKLIETKKLILDLSQAIKHSDCGITTVHVRTAEKIKGVLEQTLRGERDVKTSDKPSCLASGNSPDTPVDARFKSDCCGEMVSVGFTRIDGDEYMTREVIDFICAKCGKHLSWWRRY